MTMQTRLNITL